MLKPSDLLSSAFAAEDGDAVALADFETHVVQQPDKPPLRRIERRAEEHAEPALGVAFGLQEGRDVQTDPFDPA